MVKISVKVNGNSTSTEIEANTLLSTFLRDHLNLTGTHIGCDTGQCGACVVLLDKKTVKSCSVLALQADGKDVETVESLCVDGKLHPMQEAFRDNHALQCGFCTPGMLMTAVALAEKYENIDKTLIRAELEGNLCRCTGYQNIVEAVFVGAKLMRADR